MRVLEVDPVLAACVAWSPDGGRLALAAQTAVGVCTVDGRELWRRPLEHGWSRRLVWSPDGRRLALLRHGEVAMYAADSGTLAWQWHGRSWNNAADIAWSPDGEELTGAGGGLISVVVWDGATGELRERFAPSGLSSAINDIAVQPAGQLRLAVPSGPGPRPPVVELWTRTDIEWQLDDELYAAATAAGDDERRRRVVGDVLEARGHSEEIHSVRWAPDGGRLASGADDFTVRVWDTATGAELSRLEPGAEVWPGDVTWSPDGRLVAAGADACDPSEESRSAYVWNTVSGTLLARFSGHTRIVRSLSFSPDGARLATTGPDSTVRLWDIPARGSRS